MNIQCSMGNIQCQPQTATVLFILCRISVFKTHQLSSLMLLVCVQYHRVTFIKSSRKIKKKQKNTILPVSAIVVSKQKTKTRFNIDNMEMQFILFNIQQHLLLNINFYKDRTLKNILYFNCSMLSNTICTQLKLKFQLPLDSFYSL